MIILLRQYVNLNAHTTKVLQRFVSFWYETRILLNLHNEIIFSLTMQTASYTIVFKEFAVNADYTSDSLLKVIRNINS
jgi:hypothetical protein